MARILLPSVLLLLVSSCGVHADTQTAPRTTGGSVQFAATKSEEHSGDWSRDGKWIAFESDRTGNTDIWIQPVAGGAAIQITPDEAADFVPRWSP